MKKLVSILLALGLALSLSLVMAVPVAADTINVPGDYSTIQAAIDAANPDDTILVAAGTYDEQVVIDKNLTLEGVGDTTIVKPSSKDKLTTILGAVGPYGGAFQIAGIIVAEDADSVTVKNLKVDGELITALPDSAVYAVVGIFYRESGGTIDTVTVENMIVGTPATQGLGIYLSSASNTVSVEVKSLELQYCKVCGGMPPVPVGGEVYPVNKLAILAPWIVIGMAIVAGTVIGIRHQK